MTRARQLCAALWTVLIAGCAALPAKPDRAAAIRTEMARVADWQLSRIDLHHIATRPDDDTSLTGWVAGAFFVGLSALADRDPNYGDAIYELGQIQDWQLGPRPFMADDHLIGQTWIWAYEHKHDPRMIAPTKARFDAIMAAVPDVPLDFGPPGPDGAIACQKRWCWSDALFMGPPGWFELSRATGDPRYRDYADKEYWASVARLFDPAEGLFFRDTRYIAMRGPGGEKIFWSRGNGWVYAGLARILEFLPANDPERPRYEALFRTMSARLVQLQKPDGYWPVSLLSDPKGTPPETSGTGFFVFGLGWGVANGLLTDPKYRAAAERGWNALEAAVGPDGKLGWVQQIGSAPGAVAASDTQLYGVGAFLLAGSAMLDLACQDGRETCTEPSSLP